MSRFKILTIVGARPQFVKSMPLSRALEKANEITEIILHTGQHFDEEMSDIFFNELKLPKPKFNLNINGGHHGQMTGRMMENIETIMIEENPHAVIVYGDTNSTMAGALCAAKLHIPIFHIESGLRSFNKKMPEEINRIVTDHLSSLLFCPTHRSVKNLENEGITKGVHIVGDVMYDVTLQMKDLVQKNNQVLQDFQLKEKEFGLATIHRAENTNSFEKLKEVFDFVEDEAERLNIKVIFPIHPRTKNLVDQYKIKFKNIMISEPLGYLKMHHLLSNTQIVFTDSGGVQKEAYFYQVPCITLRDETEWVETVSSGWNRLWKDANAKAPRTKITEYGEGQAAEAIVNIIKKFLK